jgi:cyanuric acid amidohydrolase
MVPVENVTKSVYVMSGGTEGVLSPHLTVFTKQQETLMVTTTPLASEGNSNEKEAAVEKCSRGLALGICHTRDFMDDEMGLLAMVRVVRDGVLQAMSQAGLLTKDDVHFVQVKCPLSRLSDTGYKSMAMSRGGVVFGSRGCFGRNR